MRDFTHLNPTPVDLQCLNCTCCLASPIKETFFDSFELDQMKAIYTNVLYGPECQINVPRLHLSSQNCVINGQYNYYIGIFPHTKIFIHSCTLAKTEPSNRECSEICSSYSRNTPKRLIRDCEEKLHYGI